MKEVPIEKALTYIEPGPVVLVTTSDGRKNNVMTISWTMAIDFDQHIVLTTGEWNYSFGTMMRTREWRVNGALPHIQAWYDAFHITPESPMYIAPEKRVNIW